jgi:hypothetical protein
MDSHEKGSHGFLQRPSVDIDTPVLATDRVTEKIKRFVPVAGRFGSLMATIEIEVS